MSMNNIAFSFDARQVKPASEFAPLPEGLYKVIIESSELKPTKAGTGGFMEFKLKVIEGECNGRTVFERLNLWNPNDMAVQIAQQTLSAICHVVGHYQLGSLQDFINLHNKPFIIKVAVTKNKETGEINGNEIKAYKDVNGNDPGKQNAPQQSAPVQQAPSQFAQQPMQQAPQQAPAQAAWGTPAPAQTAPQQAGWGTQPATQQPMQAPAQQPSIQAWSPQAGPSGATPPWATK